MKLAIYKLVMLWKFIVINIIQTLGMYCLIDYLKALSHYCVSYKRMSAYEKYHSYAGIR